MVGALTVAEPPEFETRAAILINKAEQGGVFLSKDAAFFIAQRIRSNVRELKGLPKEWMAHAQFTRRPIDIDLIRESLKDLLALQDKLVTIDNIQCVVADYYQLKMSDLLSKRRSRSVARLLQVAMAIAKELTNHSLPEIGESLVAVITQQFYMLAARSKNLKARTEKCREISKKSLPNPFHLTLYW